METKTINIINIKDMEPGIIKVEGQSRLTPLQAINLIEHWCSIVEMRGLRVGSLYRFRVCGILIELENRNENWHFKDFVEWINNRFSKMTDKDWKIYIKDVNKGKCI